MGDDAEKYNFNYKNLIRDWIFPVDKYLFCSKSTITTLMSSLLLTLSRYLLTEFFASEQKTTRELGSLFITLYAH